MLQLTAHRGTLFPTTISAHAETNRKKSQTESEPLQLPGSSLLFYYTIKGVRCQVLFRNFFLLTNCGPTSRTAFDKNF